jgi:3-oxoacyl-[acyl-carrier-protein] synthase-1
MASTEDIVVTGMGALTALGNDAVQTAAAVRAGLVRFADWQPTGGAAEDDMGVVAAVLPDGLADGPWVGKAAALTEHPVHEALWQAQLFDMADVRRRQSAFRFGAYIACPYADRLGVSVDAYRLFAVEARQHCVSPARADHVQIVAADHAAGLMAVAQAAEDLRRGEIDVALVGGLDSLLDSGFLREMLLDGRLKSADVPAGLIPGEAGATLLLETAVGARRRGVTALGTVGAVAQDREATPLRPEAPIEGRALSRAVAKAIELCGGPARLHRIITDLNGERWRSLEWALVETRVLGGLPRAWELWHPADCVGDVGAASGVLHLVLALRAFARGYGGPDGILLTAASQRGERAAMTVFPASPASPALPSNRRS